jgi:5,10-methylenetetrahydromethanopterin reductase
MAVPKIGVTIGHNSETVSFSQQMAALAEGCGLDMVGVSDSPTIFRETYCVLTACALVTERVLLGPMVTNSQTRHPSVTASSIATVDEISRHRAFLAIGSGQSAVANAGIKKGSAMELQSAVTYVGHSLRPSGTEPEGASSTAALTWSTRPIPVLAHASGPKGIAIAAEHANGVVLRFGDVPESSLRERVSEIRRRVSTAGRDETAFQVWLYTPGLVTDDVESGQRELAGLVSARAISSGERDCPPGLLDQWRTYAARYDYRHHASNDPPINANLLRECGLLEHMIERFALIGNSESIGRRLTALGDLGIDAVVVSGAVVNKPDHIERLGHVARNLATANQMQTVTGARPEAV